METYDVECQVKFGRPLSKDQQVALKEAAQGGHTGWYGPTPVFLWPDPDEATILLVIQAPAPEEAPPEQTVCQEAETEIRNWARSAGFLAEPTLDELRVECIA